MMDHDTYRRALLSDPRSEDAGMRQHRDTCAQCAAYTLRLLQFETRLERALQLQMHAPAARSSPRRFALAAGVLLALLLAGALWLAVPRDSLAAAVVGHMAGEPDAWNTRTAVPEPQLDSVLNNANMRLRASAGVVSYANGCEFRGHVVPHLVVQTAQGPVTVMVLVHERVNKQEQFDEHGFRGLIVPVPGHGSLALLVRAPFARNQDVEGIAAQVRNAIEWSR